MSKSIKDLDVPNTGSLAEVMSELEAFSSESGLDRVRSVLAMRMSQYNDIKLNESQIRSIAKAFADIEVGSATNLVMICDKKACLYRNRCALFVSNIAPEGRECLHENKILTHALDQYILSLEIELDNYPEMVLVNQLVEYELIEYRCNAILSLEHQNMKMTSVIGIDEAGQLVTKEEVSHALSIKMQVFKNKMLILQELTATRQQKWKKQAALKEAKSGPAKVLSSMKKKLDELKTSEADVKKENVLSDNGD